MTKERLAPADALFLHLEDDNTHMHVASVTIFEGSVDYRAAVDEVARRLHLVPRFRQKLAFVPLNQGRPVWVDDPHFNIEYHLRHTALPEPGDEEQLKRLAGRVMSQTARPLEAAVGDLAHRQSRRRPLRDDREDAPLPRRRRVGRRPHRGAPRSHAGAARARERAVDAAQRAVVDLAAHRSDPRADDPTRRDRTRCARGFACTAPAAEDGDELARSARRARMGGPQPGPQDGAERERRTAPPRGVRPRVAVRVQDDQGRARRNRERRRPRRRVRRAAAVPASTAASTRAVSS